MKTITMYELLGLVKDGNAPKKIKIGNDILTLSKANIIQYNFERAGQLNWDYYIEHYRLDEKIVEILDEKKIPEKIGLINYCEDPATSIIHHKVDEIIDYLDYLKSKGE